MSKVPATASQTPQTASPSSATNSPWASIAEKVGSLFGIPLSESVLTPNPPRIPAEEIHHSIALAACLYCLYLNRHW